MSEVPLYCEPRRAQSRQTPSRPNAPPVASAFVRSYVLKVVDGEPKHTYPIPKVDEFVLRTQNVKLRKEMSSQSSYSFPSERITCGV